MSFWRDINISVAQSRGLSAAKGLKHFATLQERQSDNRGVPLNDKYYVAVFLQQCPANALLPCCLIIATRYGCTCDWMWPCWNYLPFVAATLPQYSLGFAYHYTLVWWRNQQRLHREKCNGREFDGPETHLPMLLHSDIYCIARRGSSGGPSPPQLVYPLTGTSHRLDLDRRAQFLSLSIQRCWSLRLKHASPSSHQICRPMPWSRHPTLGAWLILAATN